MNGKIKHGANRTNTGVRWPEYRAWDGMKQRCLNPKCNCYSRYGAKGITVCERWLSFENFFADMGRKPSSKHSLDRINNNLGYEPGNCRWATPSEQRRNQRYKYIGPRFESGNFFVSHNYRAA